MIFYKAFVRKKDEKYQAALLQFKVGFDGGPTQLLCTVIARQDDFDTHLGAKIWVMQIKEHYDKGIDSKWQEVN